MRKAFSITFIVLMLINSMGFYGLFLGIRFKHDADMTSRLDAEKLKEMETVTIEIPLSLPYTADSGGFERIEGKYEYNGEYYRLVKQRYANDTLTIICVKDLNEKQLQGALKNYVKTFAQEHSESHGAKFQISLIKDYLPQSFTIGNSSCGWEKTITCFSLHSEEIGAHPRRDIQPPESA